MNKLLEKLLNGFNPLLAPDDAGGGGGTDAELSDDNGNESGDTKPAAETDNIEDAPPAFDPDKAQRELERIEANERIERLEQLASRNTATDNNTTSAAGQQAAAVTGGDPDDPFADVTDQDLRDDPNLRAAKALYEQNKRREEVDRKRDEQLAAIAKRQEALDKQLEQSRKAREQQQVQQQAQNEVNNVLDRAYRSSPVFKGEGAGIDRRKQRLEKSVYAYANQRLQAGASTERIRLELESMLPGELQAYEEEYGVSTQGQTQLVPPSNGNRTREEILAADEAAKNNISAPGSALPPSKTEEKLPTDRAGMVARARAIRAAHMGSGA